MVAPALILAALAFAPAVPNPAPKSEPPAELDRWQGTWWATRMEVVTGENTARLKFAEGDAPTWAVAADRLTSKGLRVDFTASLKLDGPRAFALTIADGSHKGGVVRGSYRFEGDDLLVDGLTWPKGVGDEEQRLRLTFRKK
jgi:uncharacterized protein (TIGR03067 family)